jgi:CBS domain-containing protein
MILCHAALVHSGQTPVGLVSYEQLEGKEDMKGVQRTGESTEELELKVIASTPAHHANGHSQEPSSPMGDADTPADSKPGSADLDLRSYVNRSGVSVPIHFSAMRTFMMFRTLGLRHLPVVDEHNHVVGIVTRKELLDESLAEKLAHLGIHVSGH